MRIPIGRPAAGVLMLGLMAHSAAAQDTPDISTRFSTTTGWTSNAGGDVFQAESLFATQSGEVSTIVRGDGFALRGSIGGSQTRYLDAAYENDRGADAGLILDSQLSPDTALRGSIGVSIDETGSAFEFFGLGIQALTLSQQVDADLTLAHTWDQLEVAIDLGHTRVMNGETVFAGLPIAPQRFDPDLHLYAAGVRTANHLNDPLAILADLGVRHLEVPAADQLSFGRQPVSVVRLAAGAQYGAAGSEISAKGGADLIVAAALPGANLVLPYAMLDVQWTVKPEFGLNVSASAETLIRSPADGIADWALAASAGANWSPLDGVVVSAGGFVEQDYTATSQTLIETRRGLRFGANKRLVEGVDTGISLSFSDTAYPGGGYQSARLGLDLNAVI